MPSTEGEKDSSVSRPVRCCSPMWPMSRVWLVAQRHKYSKDAAGWALGPEEGEGSLGVVEEWPEGWAYAQRKNLISLAVYLFCSSQYL